MTTEEKLKDLILTRYNSLNEFSREINISNSTLDSILKRGIRNSTIDKILKICQALNISADALANGEIVHISNHSTENNSKPKEITDILEQAKKQLLVNDGLMFNGKPADQESINSILSAMEIGIELAKRKHDN